MQGPQEFFDQVVEICKTVAAGGVDMTDPGAFDSIVVHLAQKRIGIDEEGTRKARAESPNTVAIFRGPDGELYYIDFSHWDGRIEFTTHGYYDDSPLAELCTEEDALEDFEYNTPLTLEDLKPLRFVLRDSVKYYDADEVFLVHDRKVEAKKQKREVSRTVTLTLPDDFLDLCEECNVKPEEVLRGFVADLCDLREGEYVTNGSDERERAEQYFERCGYRFTAKFEG